MRMNLSSLSRVSHVKDAGGLPNDMHSMRYTSFIIACLSERSSRILLPERCSSRSVQAYSRSLSVKYLVKSLVADESKLSFMASLGITPYFFIKSANIDHCPPSATGASNKKCKSRPLSGSLSVAKMFSKNQFDFSNLSQNSG